MEFKKVILLKYGEIVLKGLNRSQFENILVKNIRHKLKKYGSFKVSFCQSTIYVTPLEDTCDTDGALEALSKVFGIARLCLAYAVEKNIDVICEASSLVCDTVSEYKTFKVETKRSDKKFPLTSPQISARVGEAILNELPDMTVSVTEPEITVYVEVREQAAYIHAGTLRGAGGLPVGTGGKAMLLLSGGIDSPVAGHLIAKRGVSLEAIHFESYPYTSELAFRKVLDLAGIMTDYCGSFYLHSISVKEIQEELKNKCDEDYFTLLLRRFMMKIASRIASRHGSEALITGESLGQVASQTMQAIAVTENASDIPIFRPCIAMDKEEIITVSRKIGAFETSILPYEDCCTVFTPAHPCTKPKLEKLLEQEQKLDCEKLIENALATEKVYNIG